MSTKSHKADLRRIYQSAKNEAHRLQSPGMVESIVIDRVNQYIQQRVQEARQSQQANPKLL